MQVFKTILHLLLLLIIVIIIVGTSYINIEYPDSNIEELLFYLTNGVANSDSNVFVVGLLNCLPFLILLYALLVLLFYDLTFGHHKKVYPFHAIINHKCISSIILCFITIIVVMFNMHMFSYIKNTIVKSEFIENNYVNPKNTNIEFEDKKNLIFIVIESLETTLGDNSFDDNYIPELMELLNDEEAVVFKENDNKSGMKMLTGSSWTTASLISNTSSIPFKVPVGKKFTSDNFLNGVYNLGDLLLDNGYYNELISAAYTSFGGIKDFFTKHGSYNIIDFDNYKDYGLSMKKEDEGPWGFNDHYLFEAAKERLKIISKNKQPFNLMLVGIDTHFPNGFIGEYSLNKFKEQYANAYATESKLVYDFIMWLKKQDFYKDTVVVIIGDHQSMQKNFLKNIDKNARFVYTCYVNTFSKTNNLNNRKYTSLDTFPTILGAMNVKIDGNELGLGVNMFSNEITLSEKYGYDYLNSELIKNSQFYDKYLLN